MASNNYLPQLAPYLGGNQVEDARLANAPPPENLFTSGIKSGFYEGLSGASSAVSGLGKLIGNPYLERQGRYAAEEEAATARQLGRPDLEGGLFDQGASGFLPRVGYQLAKTVPTLATSIGAAALVPQAAVPAGLSRAAEFVPSFLRAGQTGAEFARAGLGAFAAQYPAIAGGMYQQAQEREQKGAGEATPADAAKAFLLGVPVTALGSLEPASLTGLATKGAKGTLGKRVLGAGVSNAAAEGIQEGVEEAAGLSFRPDISAQDKFKSIVDATVTGGILGGITGGAFGLHKAQERAQDIPTNDLAKKVDKALNPEPLALPAPAPRQLQTEQTGLGSIEQGYDQLLGLSAPTPRQLQTEVTGRGPIEQEFSPLDLVGEQYGQNIDLSQRPQDVIQPEARIDQPDLLRSPEILGNLEARINDKRVKLTDQEKKLGQDVGLLTETGRKRNIDNEIIANDARQQTIQEKLNSERAKRNPGLQDKLQTQLEDAQKVRAELDGFKQLREQSDALQERGAAEVPVREQTQGGEGVRVEDTQGREALRAREEVQPVQEQARDVKAEEIIRNTYNTLRQQQGGFASVKIGDISDITGIDPKAIQAVIMNDVKLGNATIHPTTSTDSLRKYKDHPATIKLEGFSEPFISVDYKDKLRQSNVKDTQEPARDVKFKEVGGSKGLKLAVNEEKTTFNKAVTDSFSDILGQDLSHEYKTTYDIMNDDKDLIGTTNIRYNANTKNVEIDWIGKGTEQDYVARGNEAQTLGFKDIRSLIPEIKKLYPDAVTISGNRISGARRYTGERGEIVINLKPKAEDPLTVLDNPEKVASSEVLGQNIPVKSKTKTPGRVQRESVAVPIEPTIVTSEVPKTPTQKVTKAKRDFKSRMEAARAVAENQPPLHEATWNYLNNETFPTPISDKYAKLNEQKDQTNYADVEVPDVSSEDLKPGPDLREEAAKLSTTDNFLDSAAFSAKRRKSKDVKFKRSIEDRLATMINPENEFDRGFKKAIDVLGPNAADRIDVYNTTNDLPDNVLAEMKRQGLTAINGVYDSQTGRTLLVKDQFKTAADVQQTIFHEIFGHEGLQRIAGKDFDNFTKDLFDRAGGLAGIEKLAKRFGVDNGFEEYVQVYNEGLVDETNLVDEFLAHASERPKGKIGATLNAWVGDFKRTTVAFLRSIGFHQFANKLNQFDNFEVARLLRDMRQAVQAGGDFARPVQEAVAFKRSVDGSNDTFGKATDFGNQILQNINRAGFGPRNIKNKVRELALGWMPLTGMAEQYRHIFPAIDTLVEAWHNRDVIAQRFNENAGNVYKDITSLSKKEQQAFNDVARASEFGFDLRKPWELHTELQNLENTPELKTEFDRLQKVFKDLNKGKGKEAYENAVALGEGENYAKAASDLYAMRSLLYGNETIEGFEQNPAKAFQQNKDVHGSPTATRDFWKQIIDQQKAGIEKFVKDNKDRNIGIDTLPLEGALDIAQRRLDAASKSPYFSLGRHGNYFVTFTLPTDDRGLPKKESIAKLQDALDARGFNDVAINQASDQDRVYIRVENEDIMNTLYNLATDLQKDGTLSNKEILRGLKTQSNILGKLAPKYLDKMIQALDKHVDSDIDPAQQRIRDGMKSELRGMLLDILPDQSITKVYQQRKGRQGYSTDAARNMAFRSQITSNAISNLAILSDVSKAFGEMRKQALSATGDPNVNPVELNQVLNELSLREANRPFSPPNTLVDALRGLNFTYFLGMSPAYMVQQISQVPLIGLPELAKQQGVGFAKAGKTLAGVTTPAFKIMKAVSEGRYGLDAHITKEALQKAGIGKDTSDYILNLINRGDIDFGSFGRELSRISHGQVGGTAERALRWANSTIVYSETFSRLQMALAAERLGLTQDQASNLIKNSMFTYGSWNSPRQIGRMGLFGSFSPLAFAFTNYQIQMLEKMYRELNTAFFNKAKSPEERTAARKFLAGHITAATVTAGTLGFPAAGWLAGAASRLTDLFDGDEGEGYDVEAAYRNWLASLGGKQFGEIVARGLPRAIGIDAQNYGDQNLLPFTQLMNDRRKFEDAFPAYLKDLAGAPFSMISNLLIGGRKIVNGDILGGATQMAPRAFHAGIDAFRMTNEGYVDTKGNKLPLDVNAGNILARALGFQTGKRAEYNEAAQAVREEKYATKYRAEVIKQNLARAFEGGDRSAAKEQLKLAQNFDKRHPESSILNDFASYLQRRQTNEIIADKLNAPLGVQPTDLRSRRLAEFANF